MPSYSDTETKPPLDEKLYSLDPDELAFFKSQTRIEDDTDLKRHIVAVQRKAYEIHSYSCILRFAFTKPKISRLPAYERVLKLGRECEGAILLDIGCCFGNDVRKAVADGYPAQSVIASDLRQEFWDLGHGLFKSNPESFPAHFIAGDALDPAHLSPHPPFYKHPQTPLPSLSSLTSLTPLHGHVSVIHASSLFNLFDEAKQLELARSLASLLSPLPGSVIFGTHGGRTVKGLRTEVLSIHGHYTFCHSPDSWRELWEVQVFERGSVELEAGLREIKRSNLWYHIFELPQAYRKVMLGPQVVINSYI